MQNPFRNVPFGLALGFIIILCVIGVIGYSFSKVAINAIKNNSDVELIEPTETPKYSKFWEEFELKALNHPKFAEDGILTNAERDLYLFDFVKRYDLKYIESGKKLFDASHHRVDISKARCYLAGYDYDKKFLKASC